ncbi:acetyl esterase/lipase [Bradyrhizobium macuxiense]|uniref:Acetyl esterase/lipase n=1 Tax=Bradyrhizobium macuxiense TaxID=1755647 RepID=A0A560KX64_9BRAD|nr:alpha/beta hydrolase [Bradyrhizobium macuxiense]TWB87815.1 acetyl esterase/lipase [Bradyrhizobium macuxiense]
MREFDFDVEDIEYLRHPGQSLLARVFRPRGEGPFPCIVELHGGAWSQFDRTRGKSVHEALVRSGVVVVALDFRQGHQGAYPLSVADVNYGIRWVKANASVLKTHPGLVGLSGNSSGGHLAMLTAMRPRDPRYSAIPLQSEYRWDAGVRCVVMLWPVINPLGRYRYAKRLSAHESKPEWVDRIIHFHDGYWGSEDNMAEGNPMLALEKGEHVELPPAMWIQSQQDEVHNYVDKDAGSNLAEAERFTAAYAQAGGKIELLYFDAPMMFTTAHPTLPASVAALEKVVQFVHDHVCLEGEH